jgi:chitinase
MGRLDIDQARKGNPAKSETATTWMKGQKIWAGKFWGFMTLTPFMTTQTMLATSRGGKGPTDAPDNIATFNGRLTTRVKTDLGNFPIAFPEPVSDEDIGTLRTHHKPTEIEIFEDDILYGDGGINGSLIQMGHHLNFGLRLNFAILPTVQGRDDLNWAGATQVCNIVAMYYCC